MPSSVWLVWKEKKFTERLMKKLSQDVPDVMNLLSNGSSVKVLIKKIICLLIGFIWFFFSGRKLSGWWQIFEKESQIYLISSLYVHLWTRYGQRYVDTKNIDFCVHFTWGSFLVAVKRHVNASVTYLGTIPCFNKSLAQSRHIQYIRNGFPSLL